MTYYSAVHVCVHQVTSVHVSEQAGVKNSTWRTVTLKSVDGTTLFKLDVFAQAPHSINVETPLPPPTCEYRDDPIPDLTCPGCDQIGGTHYEQGSLWHGDCWHAVEEELAQCQPVPNPSG